MGPVEIIDWAHFHFPFSIFAVSYFRISKKVVALPKNYS